MIMVNDQIYSYPYSLSEWVKQTLQHHSWKHLVLVQIKPCVFNRTVCVTINKLSEKEFPDKMQVISKDFFFFFELIAAAYSIN